MILNFSNYEKTTLSNNSKKLLEKIVILAMNLEKRAISKYPNVNFNSSQKRLLLLFSALKLISLKFCLGSKLLQFDWLIEILSEILCKVGLEISLKVLKVDGGVKKLSEDLKMAKKLKTLQILRAALRKDENLKVKLVKEEAQNFLLTIENRAKVHLANLRLEQGIANIKLEQEISNLRLNQDQELKDSLSLKRFIHIWRCILNLRLVKERTRKRVKSSILSKWRKGTRISTISGIYYGKKVKLRLMNRWYSKKFGKSKEQQLKMRLNDFISRKKRRVMLQEGVIVNKSNYLTGAIVNKSHVFFKTWRNELNGRRADYFYSKRILSKSFKKLIGNLSLNQGRNQTCRLYNEIRLLKNFFYKWFTSVIPDRYIFERERNISSKKESELMVKLLKNWSKKLKKLVKINEIELIESKKFENRKILTIFNNWKFITKQKVTRLIWTENFRLTEDLRNYFNNWRLKSKNQIISDTKYQFNLCKIKLKNWRNLFEERQEKRFKLKQFFKIWKSFSQGRRGIRFLRGQELLRNLTKSKVSNSILASTLEISSNFESPNYSKKISSFFKWKNQIKRIQKLKDFGNIFLLERIKKVLQIWRLKTFQLNVIKNEPIRIKTKTFNLIKNLLKKNREKLENLDSQLFHYYTNRAIKLESFYFHKWEKAFQITQIGENCCIKILKLWESEKRTCLFRRWQCQTAGIIFGKCKRITEQQGIFSLWRNNCKSEINRRSFRILSKHFQIWCQVSRQRNLENREIQFRHLRSKLKNFSIWKLKLKETIQSWSRANDFFFIVRGSRSIDLWKQKLEALRIARSKTQTLLLLKAPVVRKPRIEQLMANAASLSDIKKVDADENDQLVMGNLNIAELSV